MSALDLLSSSSRVETPFVVATIAGYTFGSYNKSAKYTVSESGAYNSVVTDYPNFMQSLTINKINGTVNTYTLVMKYAVRPGDDPNLLEKVFSKAKNERKITLSYGDYSVPSFIYKEEEALITDVKSNVDFNSSTITYTISCVSQALSLSAGTYNFGKRVAKPSDVIKEILYDERYGLLDVFQGMKDKQKVLDNALIASNDKVVTIEAQSPISLFNYLNYLVECMTDSGDSSRDVIKSSRYVLSVYDDISNEFGGTYFKVTQVDSATKFMSNTTDTQVIDIGFPTQNVVIGFTIDDNQTYSILYDYSQDIDQSNYVYRIDDEGNVTYIYSPSVSNSEKLMKTTEADKTWWTQVTQYPISATLTIKGLLKPAILMTYVRLNVMFYGRKHISSGVYIVTKQTDTIDGNGYKTQLKLTRIKGDDEW